MKPQRLLAMFTASSVFFLGYELGAGFSFYLLELSLLSMGICLIAVLWPKLKKNPLQTLGKLTMMGERGGVLVMAALIYLAVDLAGVVYSPEPMLMWPKYRVLAGLLIVAASVSFLRNEPGVLRTIRRAVAASGIVICAMTLFNYFALRIYPILYTLRLSLRSDYNMFGTAVFIGMVEAFFDRLECRDTRARHIGLVACSSFMLPVILLSGSRRILLVLPAALAVMMITWAIVERRWAGRRTAKTVLLLGLLCAGLVIAQTSLYGAGMRRLSSEKGTTAIPGLLGGVETTLSERYATVASSSIFSKRLVIWGLAVKELGGYSPVEWITGRGAGENILLYDRVGEELDAIYPDREKRMGALSAHNMLLADLIDGGLIKLAAGLWLLGVAAWLTLDRLFHSPLNGLSLAIILALCVLNSMVSNRFGLLYDRYFMLYIVLLAAGAARKGIRCETHYRNADYRSSL